MGSNDLSSIVPPQDILAEQGILGGILIYGDEVLADVAATLKPESFYDPRHRKIFEIMLDLYVQGKPVDEITIASNLNDIAQFQNIGDISFLEELGNITVSLFHIEHYIKSVMDKFTLREFINAAYIAIERAYSKQVTPDIALEEAESSIFTAIQSSTSGEPVSVGKIITSSLAVTEKYFRKKDKFITGVPTGFKKLDLLTNGLQKSDLVIIAGRPSMGKTSFVLNIATNAALRYDIPSVIFSLEMNKEQLGLRFLSSESRISASKLKKGLLENKDWLALERASTKLNFAKIYVDDTPSLGCFELRSRARRIKATENIGLIIVDYLQLMQGEQGSFGSREREISSISHSLKALAKELEVPVVALSQLNRRVEERGNKRPLLSDLRESGAIEQDADVIMFIHREFVYSKRLKEKNIAEIIVRKQRNGPVGNVKLFFFDEMTKFENLLID